MSQFDLRLSKSAASPAFPYLALTLLALLCPAQSVAQNLFTAASGSPFGVGTGPESVAVADFNGDGFPDLAIANLISSNVTVLLGNGSGGFTAASDSPFSAGSNPRSVAVGDFNGDGHPDLAIANEVTPGLVTVLLGNGSGGFSAATGSPFSTGSNPISVAVGDFNGDGIEDLAVANQADNTVTVLLGDGSGGFSAATGSPLSTGSGPISVAIGDFNGDGHSDLAIANDGDNTVTVLLGTGSGGFTAATGSPFAAGTFPTSVAVADFNGDGHSDLAIADRGGEVTVLLGNGSGQFTAATGSPFAAGGGTFSVVAADLNGDGYPDLATANEFDNNVTVLLGNGSGGFTAATGSPFATGTQAESVAVGDFNGVGLPDLAIANSSDNNVTVLLNNAPGLTANPPSLTFYASAGQAASASVPVSIASTQSGSTYTVSANQTWLQATPLSNPTGSTANVTLSAASSSLNAGTYSGIVRFLAPNFFDATTAVTLNVTNPSGTLSADTGSPFTVGDTPVSVAVADVNEDGHPDLITANYGDNTVSVLLGDGLGGFTAASGSPLAVGELPESIAVADFNGDGHPDLAIANNGDNTVTVLLGNGSGGFTAVAGSPFAVGSGPTSVAVADFNGDGHPDLAVANSSSNNVTVLLGNGFGEFFPARDSTFAVGSSPVWVAVGDFNGDGYQDLAVVNSGDNAVTVLLGNGRGGFTAAAGSPFTVGNSPASVTVADFNLDGHPDLAVVNVCDNTVTVLLGNGRGGFTAVDTFVVGQVPSAVVAADFNGDGYPDLAVANNGDNTVTVLLGNGSGGFTAASGVFAVGSGPQSIATGDFNEDGRPDFVTANAGGNNATVLLGASAATSSTLSTTAGSTITYGTSVPLNVTVSDSGAAFNSPTGTATFYDSATSLGSATQTSSPYTFSTSTLGGGAHTLKAVYNGDPRSQTSTSNTIPITVTPVSQTITFNQPSNETLGSAPFTINASASSGLPVTFTSTTLTVCTVSGATVTIVAAGTCSITANQAGNSNYTPAAGVMQSFQVVVGAQTITFPALANVVLGTAPFALSASASSGLPVTFTSTTSTVCTVSGATVTVLAVGTCSITASQAGNASYAAAPNVSQSFTVASAAQPQTVTFPSLPNVSFGAASFTISASASSGLPVTFASTTPSVCAVSGSTVTVLTLGTCSITASQAGNAHYSPAANVTQSFTVYSAAQTINFSIPFPAAYPITAGTFMVTASASSGLPVTFTSLFPSVCTVSGATVTILSTGDCLIRASQAGNTNVAPATPVTVNFVIGLGTQTINFTIPSHTSSDAPFQLQATASSGLPVVFSVVSGPATISGNTLTITGVGTITVKAVQAGNSSYGVATTTATFNVTLGVPAVMSVGSGASYATGTVAPDSYAVVFGSSFATQPADGDGASSQQIAGVTLSITDNAGNSFSPDIYYASFGQIDFVVPAGIAGGAATLTIGNTTGKTATASFTVAAVAPGLFTADSSGKGAAAADVTIVSGGQSQPQPAYRCSGSGSPLTCSPVPIPLATGTQVYLILFGTGIRGAGTSGVSVTIGGVAATVEYAGPQGQFPALDQVNVLVPPSLAGAGEVQLILTANGIAANPVTVQFQ
jgi:uncharacterized protein (TIGR03437 family)